MRNAWRQRHHCSPEEVRECPSDTEKLMNAVRSLPVKYREVILLYYGIDQSGGDTCRDVAEPLGVNPNDQPRRVTYQDMARWLGVSPATVNARLTEARRRLRDALDNGQ